MNQRAWVPWSRTRCSAAACVGTTRMRPSAPIPARRSVRRRTSSAVTSREPSRSATSTKSFSVPWPLVKCSTPVSVISPIVAHPTAPRRVRPHRGYDVQRPVGHLRVVIPEPVDARIRSEPRLLPPGKPAGRRDRVLDGLLDTEEAIEDTITATCRFARRQESWFRPDPRIHWLGYDDPQVADRALDVIASVWANSAWGGGVSNNRRDD